MNFKPLFALLLICTLNGSTPVCSQDIDSEDPPKSPLRSGRTYPVREIPWERSLLPQRRVIYGDDNRLDVFRLGHDMRGQIDAASACALISSTDITDNGNGTWKLQLSSYVNPGTGNPPCEGEPFAGQPTAAFCTGWLVGADLVATAGHCYNASDLANSWFVFGFHMQDASTPVMVVDDSQVYRGVEIVSTVPSGDQDHSLIRVDRIVEAANARPMRIGRVGGSQFGMFPPGSRTGVMGHPAGLPLKAAFGDSTVVLENDPSMTYFRANLDTYGGNSGSPVFNVAHGRVEGILVRGAQDYIDDGTCFVSNMLPDNSFGEESTKTSVFEAFVPEPDGVYFDKAIFPAPGRVDLILFDSNLAGIDPVEIQLNTGLADEEFMMLNNVDAGVWTGSIMIDSPGSVPLLNDGLLQVVDNGYVHAVYNDTDRGDGQPYIRHDAASIDGSPPVISNVVINSVGADFFNVTLDTDESSMVIIEYGTTPGNLDDTLAGNFSTSHKLSVGGLDSCTAYYFRIQAIGLAGSRSTWNNEGDPAQVMTADQVTQFEDRFEPQADAGWSHFPENGADNWDVRTSTMAASPVNVFSYSPGAGTVADARLVTPAFEAGGAFSFHHRYDIESTFDGAVLEISEDAGHSWTDLEDHITGGGYNSTISTIFESPIPGQNAWSGDESGAMTQVRVDLSSFSGMVQVAFRFTSDSSVPSGFWEIDDVQISRVISCVPETLRVISPNGGESFTGDSLAEVEWISNTDTAGTAVRIDLMNSQGYIDMLGIDWSTDGENTISVYLPLLPKASDYRIRIESLWNPLLSDTSDSGFEVTSGAVAVHRPNGGETWNSGDIQPIHWQASTLFAGTGFNFELWDDTSSVADLGFGWDPDGEDIHYIIVPDVPSGNNYRVRVISTWDNTFQDDSDAVFTIINPTAPAQDTAVPPGSWFLYDSE
jgi:hypothetical protein